MRSFKKKTLDVPDELYERLMEYAWKTRKFKFTPTVIDLLNRALAFLEE